MQIHRKALLFQISPYLLLLPEVLLRSAHQADGGRNAHDLIQVDIHVLLYIFVFSLKVLLCHDVDHDLVDLDLLVDPADHDLFVDRLVFPSNKIMIKIHIHVIDGIDIRIRLEGEDIVNIEGMIRQMQA